MENILTVIGVWILFIGGCFLWFFIDYKRGQSDTSHLDEVDERIRKEYLEKGVQPSDFLFRSKHL